MMRQPSRQSSLERYTSASQSAARRVIAAYSTSFGIATRLLGPRHRTHVRNIYALVRIADELVDGVAEQARVSVADQRRMLAELEAETERAMRSGYSSNPVVHAFAVTAREAAIEEALTRPFFASMRMDLPDPDQGNGDVTTASQEPGVRVFGEEDHATYVYGSAEVVGLMCLRVFMRDGVYSEDEKARLEHGARQLGAAFQNVNFLRDLGEDADRLGRDYLVGETALTPDRKQFWITTIRGQLADAEATLPLLPSDARGAVDCALRLFSRLARRIDRTPAADLRGRRVRVSNPMKAWLALQSVLSARKASAV